MALLDLAEMRRKCRAGQWSLADIDWDAPGRETVTRAQTKRMHRFMADLVWIENQANRASMLDLMQERSNSELPGLPCVIFPYGGGAVPAGDLFKPRSARSIIPDAGGGPCR